MSNTDPNRSDQAAKLKQSKVGEEGEWVTLEMKVGSAVQSVFNG
jgi:hypothetical protein